MRIMLTMVGITLGIAIAVVAGVYGWQQFASTAPVPAPIKPVQTAQAPSPQPAPPTTPKPAQPAPAPVQLPKEAPKPMPPVAAPATGKQPPVAAPKTEKPATPPAGEPTVPAEEAPIAVPAEPVTAVATPEKLESLRIGMTLEETEQAMGAKGVKTPDDQVPAYQPDGWEEVRWPNADGSYIAALFNTDGQLVHLQPFNMPGAYEWMSNPHYAIPAWLNDKLQAANMIVRVPSVDVVEAQAGAEQFQGALVNASGEFLGSISGSYYTGEAAVGYTRGIEGTYQYSLPNGQIDSNTFQFTE